MGGGGEGRCAFHSHCRIPCDSVGLKTPWIFLYATYAEPKAGKPKSRETQKQRNTEAQRPQSEML